MSNKDAKQLREIIRSDIFDTVGCTDPVAIALSVATGCRRLEEITGDDSPVEDIKVSMNATVFKNAIAVGIPGTSLKGILPAIALALVSGGVESGLLLFQDVGDSQLKRADEILKSGRPSISLELIPDEQLIHISTQISRGDDQIRVETLGHHDGIVSVEYNDSNVYSRSEELSGSDEDGAFLRTIDIPALMELVEYLPEDSWGFLNDAWRINKASALPGLENPIGMGVGYQLRNAENSTGKIRALTSAAVDVRMAGVPNRFIGSGGSGNHGIVLFLTLGEYYELQPESLVRPLSGSLALAIGLLLIIKQYTGILTPICGCAVSAGAATAAALCYAMGGNAEEVEASLNLVLANLSGMLCDGAKHSCSLKISTGVSVIMDSAHMAMQGVRVPLSDGFIREELHETLSNLGLIHKEGMEKVNTIILDILKDKQLG